MRSRVKDVFRISNCFAFLPHREIKRNKINELNILLLFNMCSFAESRSSFDDFFPATKTETFSTIAALSDHIFKRVVFLARLKWFV